MCAITNNYSDNNDIYVFTCLDRPISFIRFILTSHIVYNNNFIPNTCPNLSCFSNYNEAPTFKFVAEAVDNQKTMFYNRNN